MKKVYITPTIFFDEVLDSEELLQLSKNEISDLTGGDWSIGDGSSLNGSTIKGDGGGTNSDGFVNSKGGFFDDDIMSDWDF